MLNEAQEARMDERIGRLEGLVERLDQIGSKYANAAETMAEAANRNADAAETMDAAVQNLGGELARDRQRRRTGG